MFNEGLRLLEEAQTRAVHGTGSIVILAGDSGIGKTHTVQQFLKTRRSSGEVLLDAKGRPQTPNPLYPVYEAVASHLRDSRWKASQLQALFKDHKVMLPRMSGLLRPLLQGDSDLQEVETTVKPALFESSPYPHCLEFVREVAQGAPLLFWIDDLQWVDRETLRFLMYLRDRVSRENMLWILCLNRRRPGILAKEELESTLSYLQAADAENVCHFLELQQCSRSDLPALLSSILDGPVTCSDSVLSDLYAKSRGVPYVLKTFLEVLRNSGGMRPDASGGFRITDAIGSLSLPESLQKAIAARLKSVFTLLPGSREVLETAAVIGERFEEATLEAVLNLCDTYRLLASIEENHFIVRNLLELRLWEFEHVTVRDFIYEALGERATALHRRLAFHLVQSRSEDYSQVAYHFRRAGDEELSISYELRQIQQWLRQGFFEEARRLCDRLWRSPALFEHPDYLEQRFQLEYGRALIHFHIGEYEICLQMLHEVAALCPDHKHDPLLVLLKAKCLNKSSSDWSFREARGLLAGLREREEVKADRLLLGRIYAELVVSYAHLNDFINARAAFAEGERFLDPLEAPIERAQLMRKAIAVYEYELAEKIILRAVGILRKHRADHEVVMALNNVGALHYLHGRFRDADATLTEALAISSRLGNFSIEYPLNNLALVYLRTGDAEHALEVLRKALGFTRRAVNRLVILDNQAAALIMLNLDAAALEVLTRLLPEAVAAGEDVYLVGIRLNLALACLKLGDYSRAFLHLAACNTGRLSLNWKEYEGQRSALLLYALDSLGAIRTVTGGPRPPAPLPEPHAIDLQFWGD